MWPSDGEGQPLEGLSSYGVYDCTMRYQLPQKHPKDHAAVFDNKVFPFSTRFCRADEVGTDLNNQPVGSDNCWGQLDFTALP